LSYRIHVSTEPTPGLVRRESPLAPQALLPGRGGIRRGSPPGSATARAGIQSQSPTAVLAERYLSIRYTERLTEAGAVTSVGSRGDSYDNALAESIIRLYKTELIRKRGPWRTLEDLEFATLEWVDWFNHRRLLEPIGSIPADEFEEMCAHQLAHSEEEGLKHTSLR